MKKRILSAAVLVPILLLLILVLDKIYASVAMGLLLSIGAYELLYRTRLVMRPRLVIYSVIMAFAVAMWSYMEAIQAFFLLMVMAYFMLLFTEMMMDHVKVRIEMLGLCVVAGLIIPYLLSSLIRILILNLGRYVIPIPFIIAFMSDAGAYFVGIKFGKHKLAPVVSPNKTIEGVGGGLAGSMIGMLLYAIVMDLILKFDVNYGFAIRYGLAGSCVGTFGDLCFSVIKRQTGIKDYGNLIPGHGGVLDRFDSLVMVAPMVEALLLLLPVIAM